MRTTVAFLVLGALAGDPTPAGAIKKLSEKKNYGFTVETKIEGEALGAAARALEQAVTGEWEKPDVFVATVGRGAGVASKGGRTVYSVDGKTWDTAANLEKTLEDRAQAALELLVAVVPPHAEWTGKMGQTTGLAKRKEREEECLVYEGALTKSAAKEIAEAVAEPAQPRGDGVGRRRIGGGAGSRLRGGERNGEIRVKDAAGTVKYLIGEDDLPRRMVLTVTAEITRQEDGKPVESEVTITRTWTFEKVDESPAEIPEGAKAKLK